MKKVTFKKLLELSDEKLGMTKQYYVPKEDVLKDEPTITDGTWFGLQRLSDVETTTFNKKVYLCKFMREGLGGLINMEVAEYHQLEDLPSMSNIN
jgi:hypothetical protein